MPQRVLGKRPAAAPPAMPEGCTPDVFDAYCKLKKTKRNGKAPWWREYSIKLYCDGDVCEDGSIVNAACVKLVHTPCGKEFCCKRLHKAMYKSW